MLQRLPLGLPVCWHGPRKLNTCLSHEVQQTRMLAQDDLSHVTTKCLKDLGQRG
jgi:hypothetical protein